MRRIALPLAILLLLTAQLRTSLYYEGVRAAVAGDLRRANDLLSCAVRDNDQEAPNYYVHYWLGVVRQKLGDREGALREWHLSVRQGVAVDRTDVTARLRALEEGHPIQSMPQPERPVTMSRPPRPTTLPRTTLPAPPPPETTTIAMATMPTETAARTTTTTMVTSTMPTSTTAATTTAATTTEAPHAHTGPDASAFDEIDRRFKELSPGEVVFTAPETMRVADTYEVSLRIAAKDQNAGILEGLPDGATSTMAQEHITPVMEARLSGGAGVDVQALGKDEQSVAGGGFAEWRWNVTPKRSGSQRLTATLIAHLTYPNGRDIPKTVRTLTRKVEVSANAGDSIKTFFASYWQWLTTTLIIPIGLFLYRRRANRDTVAEASGTDRANAAKK
jgi:hypothetical protein